MNRDKVIKRISLGAAAGIVMGIFPASDDPNVNAALNNHADAIIQKENCSIDNTSELVSFQRQNLIGLWSQTRYLSVKRNMVYYHNAYNFGKFEATLTVTGKPAGGSYERYAPVVKRYLACDAFAHG